MCEALPAAPMCTGCATLRWAELEGPYAANLYNGAFAAGNQRHLPGRQDLLLSAANSVNYFRGDVQRKAARWTGSGVEALALATGASVIAMAAPPRQVPYTDSPEYAYADRLRTLVTPGMFVLDVIGMRDRQIDVCIGMGPKPRDTELAVAERIQRGFTSRGVRVGIDKPFGAKMPFTVTNFVQTELGAHGLQIGLAAWLRDPLASRPMAQLALDVLRDGLSELS